MPVFEWKNDYELGIELLDEHHKHLVDLLNTTYDSFTGGASNEVIEEVLDKLIDYAIYHFAAEEHLMQSNKYPKLQQHRGEHDRFSRRVVEIQVDFHNGKKSLSIEVLNFLKNWLMDHVLKSDAEFGVFLSGLKRRVA